MYSIELTKAARKAYLKLPKHVREQIYAKLQKLALSPVDTHLNVKALKGHNGYYRLRVNDYRVVYQLKHTMLKEIYR